MADSRNKGAAFERDIVKRLNIFFEAQGIDVRCKRNLDQYQAKNLCDITIPGSVSYTHLTLPTNREV